MIKTRSALKTIFVGTSLSLGSLLIILIGSVLLYIEWAPQFGHSPTNKEIELYTQSGHYEDGKFLNLEPFALNLDCHSIIAMLQKAFNPPEKLRPSSNIDVSSIKIEKDTDQFIGWDTLHFSFS
jgi:hypothetical protein